MSLRKKPVIKRISVTETKYGRTIRVSIQLYIKKDDGKTLYKEIPGTAILFDLDSPAEVDAAVGIIRNALLTIKIGDSKYDRHDRPAKVAGRA